MSPDEYDDLWGGLTEASRDLLRSWSDPSAEQLSERSDWTRDWLVLRLPAIEAAAAKREFDRLHELYAETDAGEFCDTDVLHEHAHQMCNARCWCSWADPKNCPYPPRQAPRQARDVETTA